MKKREIMWINDPVKEVLVESVVKRDKGRCLILVCHCDGPVFNYCPPFRCIGYRK